MYRVVIPVPAELIVESEDPEAIQRWLYSLTYTDECTADCVYNIPMARGMVTASFRFDPALINTNALPPEAEPSGV